MQQQPESALPRCPMCGAALQSTATACPACGTPLAGLVLTPRTPTAFATAPAALPTTPAAPSATEPAPTAVADAATAGATTTDATTTDATDATERCDWCGQVSPAGDEQCAHCGAMFPRPETDAALLRQADERRRAEMESLMTMRRRHQRKGLGRLFSN